MDTGLAVAVLLAVAFAVTKGLHDASNAIATLLATRPASPLQGIGEELADASVIPADEVGRFSLVSKDLDDLAVTFMLPDVVTLDHNAVARRGSQFRVALHLAPFGLLATGSPQQSGAASGHHPDSQCGETTYEPGAVMCEAETDESTARGPPARRAD
jgi:hypothetical protein